MAFTLPPDCDQQCRQALAKLQEAEETCRQAMKAGYDFTGEQAGCQYYRQLMEGTLKHLTNVRRE